MLKLEMYQNICVFQMFWSVSIYQTHCIEHTCLSVMNFIFSKIWMHVTQEVG